MTSLTLSNLKPIGAGLSCAFVSLDVSNMCVPCSMLSVLRIVFVMPVENHVSILFRSLTDVSLLEKYIHLRFVDLSRNQLDDVTALSSMLHLLQCDASRNRLRRLHLERFPFLQVANFSHNKLTSLESLSQPQLQQLNMSCTFN